MNVRDVSPATCKVCGSETMETVNDGVFGDGRLRLRGRYW
jgi:hypothetical protein